jgi:hypothetical protein
MSVKDNLKKALHKAIFKAYQNGKAARAHSVRHIVADIRDPNNKPQVPSKDLPAPSEGVLHKDVSVSEIHQQKQSNAQAKLGQAPQKPPKPFSAPAAAAAPAAPAGGNGVPKMKPLKSFMQKKEQKRQSEHGEPGKNRPLHERGVNPTVKVGMHGHMGDAKEQSLQGIRVRRGDTDGAKRAAKEILSETKGNKPNLPKSEDGK